MPEELYICNYLICLKNRNIAMLNELKACVSVSEKKARTSVLLLSTWVLKSAREKKKSVLSDKKLNTVMNK